MWHEDYSLKLHAVMQVNLIFYLVHHLCETTFNFTLYLSVENVQNLSRKHFEKTNKSYAK